MFKYIEHKKSKL